MLRIIAGKYKNMVIPIVKNASYRPSTGQLREGIFNILTSGKIVPLNYLQNSLVLDIFSGTGSLGFEALSRGAKTICFIDINRSHLETAQQFSTKIERIQDTKFLCLDAQNLPHPVEQYNLIFLDPPYYSRNLITKSLESLVSQNWIKDNAIIIIESSKIEDIILPNTNKLERIMERVYGSSKILILRYSNIIELMK